MNNVVNPEEYFKEKAERLYKESDKEDEDYRAIVNKFDIKHTNGKVISEADVMEVVNQMQKLHDSVETHRAAVIAENAAEKFRGND